MPEKIIITGISRGLGRAVGESLPKEKVLGITRSIPKNFDVDYLQIDISDYKRVGRVLFNNDSLFDGKKTALVLCAGTLGKSSGIFQADFDDWNNTIKTNLLGNLAVIQSTMSNMINTGYGRIVFVAGGGAAYAFPKFSAYAISKVAIVREVENIAEEYENIIDDFSIIALAPGAMKTDMLKKVRMAGAEVKTTVDISNLYNLLTDF